jgi:hypothetical protein
MLNKTISVIAAVVVLMLAGCLIAQKTENQPGLERTQETRILNVLEDMRRSGSAWHCEIQAAG